MKHESYLKKGALVGALVLPILLILVVWLLTSGTKTLNPKPQFDFMYAVNEPYYYATQIIEQDGKPALKYLKRPNTTFDEKTLPKLYLYSIQNRASYEITYQVQGEFKSGDDWQVLPILSNSPQILVPGKVAPDQYTYERRYHHGDWFPLFSHRSRNSHVIYLEDNVLVFSNHNHVTFLGWVKPKVNHYAR